MINPFYRTRRGRKTPRSFWFAGMRLRCPVCGFRARRFLALPQEYRKVVEIGKERFGPCDFETANVNDFTCPSCWADDKTRLYCIFLERRFAEGLRGEIRLLHVAPEKQLTGIITKTYPFVVSRTLDLNRDDVDDRLDVRDMHAYEDALFDCFICSHVLEHLPDGERDALNELHRVLRPDGWGIVMVPVLPAIDRNYEEPGAVTGEDRKRVYGLEDHYRIHSKKGLVESLESAGFSVEEVGVDYFGASVFRRAGITEKSVLYVVEKEAG